MLLNITAPQTCTYCRNRVSEFALVMDENCGHPLLVTCKPCAIGSELVTDAWEWENEWHIFKVGIWPRLRTWIRRFGFVHQTT